MSNEVVERTTRLVQDFDERVQGAAPDAWPKPTTATAYATRILRAAASSRSVP